MCFYSDKSLSFFNTAPLLAAGSLIFLFGILDDIVEMRAILKLIVQLIATAIVVLNGYCFRQIFGLMLPEPVGILLTFFWLLGMINAYNLIDGLDGLCGTLALTALVSLGIMLYGSFNEGTAVCFILSASILGFLVFNWPAPNAKIFMGDTGSTFLGFMLATMSIEGFFKFYAVISFAVPFLILGLPIFDTASAIMRRLLEGRSPMSPDRGHVHHKLVDMGFNVKQAVAILYAISGTLGLAAVILTTSGEAKAMVLILAVILVMALGGRILWTLRNSFHPRKEHDDGKN